VSVPAAVARATQAAPRAREGVRRRDRMQLSSS
jgi:hypothetical protein